MEVEFEHPAFLLFVLLIPLLAAVHVYSLKHARQKAIRFANIDALEKIVVGGDILPKNYGLLAMRSLALVGFTLAASGLTIVYQSDSLPYDYVIAIDTSSSMLAQDLAPDRMTAARESAKAWLSGVPGNSKIGLVDFSSQARTVAALGSKEAALSHIGTVYAGASGGTALCEAIRASANLLIGSQSPKAVILLSDGQNNAGCTLEEGINYAKENEVKVFSIGVGSYQGGSPEGIPGAVFKLNDSDLIEIAKQTGGQYFAADNAKGLADAFSSLGELGTKKEKTTLAAYLMMASFLLVFIDWGLSVTRYRAIP